MQNDLTMKKLKLLILITLSTIFSVSAETLKVDFENGAVPTGWTASGVTIKKDNNSNRAAMGSNATLISPDIKGLRSVSYIHRGSGSNKLLTVEASSDGGNSWEQIGSSTVSSSSTYGSASHSVTASPESAVRVRFTCHSATIFVDDIELSYTLLDQEPTTQATITAGEVTGNSIEAAIGKGDGSGRLAAMVMGSTLDWAPTDGTTFNAPFPKKSGDVIILASGDIESVKATGLLPATTYTIGVFEYNGDGEKRNYLTSPMAVLTVTTPAEPVFTLPTTAIDFMNTLVGGSKERTLTIAGSFLTPESGKVTLTSDTPEFSLSADGVNFSSTLSVDYTGGLMDKDIIVRFNPTSYGSISGQIKVTGGGAEGSFTVKGTGADRDNREIFIAPDGNDAGEGTIDSPWLNLQKAADAASPGDVIYCRGGRYHFTQRDSSGKLTVRLKKSGQPDAPITITAYRDEQPIFDFEQQLLDCNRDRSKVGDRGMLITGNYWHLHGLHIMHAADNGIKLEGSYNRIERCEFSYNLDSGLQMGFGHNFSDSGLGSHNDGSFCAYNDIIDCDSHHNCDYDANYGSDADGFACKMHNGEGNRFIRCRAWRNSDDAWDLYETDFSVTLIECWAWESGKAEDHTWVYDYFDKGPNFSGNGNGIKLGGNGSGGSSKGVHYAYNCISFGNNKSGSTKGFDCNSHKGGHVVIGGLAFDNGYDFMFESGGGDNSEFYNNVCFGRQEILVGKESNNALGVTPQAGKTFFNNVVTGFSRSDYESLAEADALAPRGEDGSMPAKFGRLKSGSKLIDKGIDKPLPFTDEFPALYQPVYGNGRDLGPYELEEGPISSIPQLITDPDAELSLDIDCSQGGNEVTICVSTDITSDASFEIVGMQGITLATHSLGRLEQGTKNYRPISTLGLQKGIYIGVLKIGMSLVAKKFAVR